MRRIAWIAVLLSACGALWGQEITEENFLKEESALTARFEAQSEHFSGQFAAAQSQAEERQLDGSLQRSFPAVSSRHGGLECAIRSDPQRPATVFCDAARPVQGYPSHRMEASAEGAAWQPVRPGDGSSWSGQGTAPGRKDVQSSCVGCAGEAFSVASMARDTGAAALRRLGLHGRFGTGIPRCAVCENLPGGASGSSCFGRFPPRTNWRLLLRNSRRDTFKCPISRATPLP